MASTVQLDLTPAEYRALIEMLYISDWIMHAHETNSERDPKKKSYDDLQQRILALAEQAGCDDLIFYDKKLQGYYPTQALEMDGPAPAMIDEHVDHVFWDELAERLADRDMWRRFGKVGLKRMKHDERFFLHGELSDHYMDEFIDCGLDRLEIVEKTEPQP